MIMEHLSFNNRLQLFGNNLTRGEQNIAAYILAHMEEIPSIGSKDLSHASHTSPSTLTRFCKKLNYRNFIELQTLLTVEKSSQATPSRVVELINHYYESVIEATRELIDPAQLDQFVSQIQNADKIMVFGLGSSALTASEFNIRLVQMGFNSSAIVDSILMSVQSRLFSPKDLIIVISNSGETPEVLRACQLASESKVPICILTSKIHSSLADLADTILLAADTAQTEDKKFVNNQMTLMFIIDAISYQLLEDPKREQSRDIALQKLFERQGPA